MKMGNEGIVEFILLVDLRQVSYKKNKSEFFAWNLCT